MNFFKKTLIFIAILSMLFSVSCSQSNITDNNTDQCSVYPGLIAEYETDHTFGDFQITVESIDLDYSSSGITLKGSNPTEKLASFDTVFDIERLHEDHWESCETESPKYSDTEKGIPEKSTAGVTYDWGNYFDVKTPGTYRFKTNIIDDAIGAREQTELTIEFTVAYDSIIPTLLSYEISDNSVQINVNWDNNFDNNIYLTDIFYVEALNDGEWVECERTDVEFPLSVFSVAPGKSAQKNYNISEKFELTYYGNYRVYIEYAVGSGDASQNRCALIEFYIPYEIN